MRCCVTLSALGWLFRKLNIPLVPGILGILLGQLMGENLRRALNISDGDISIFYGSQLAMAFLTLAVVGFVLPIVVGRFFRPACIAEAIKGDGISDRAAPHALR